MNCTPAEYHLPPALTAELTRLVDERFKALVGELEPRRPRLARIAWVAAHYPFKRSSLYNLMDSGAVKSVVVPAASTGRPKIRLIDLDSLDRYLLGAGVPDETEPCNQPQPA
jgi:hypothetical protein